MIVRCQVEDGYYGVSRPQETIIDDELNDCETEEEREKLISDYIQEDFDNKIFWHEISRRER